jgi:hypothetical protein
MRCLEGSSPSQAANLSLDPPMKSVDQGVLK